MIINKMLIFAGSKEAHSMLLLGGSLLDIFMVKVLFS